ncbi:MAG TPA: universal stress protein [Gaiellaceae bacterium]|jgi:nucleotide-binding universal stress UspA family protein|nr:universal stress protein [Gaiellaceae bacterium]
MYETVVWATDASHIADDALPEALRVLEPGGRLLVFHCDERFPGSRTGGTPVLADEADRRAKLHEQVEDMVERGIDAVLFVETTHHNAAVEIARFASDQHAEAIVCGSRGQGAVTGTLTGSVAMRLPHFATCPVIVVSERAAARHAAPVR